MSLPDPAPPLAWMAEARCKGATALMFPVRTLGQSGPTKEEEQAKAICRQCPVIGPCRTYALDTQEPYGVFGGLGEAERRRILRKGYVGVHTCRRCEAQFSATTSAQRICGPCRTGGQECRRCGARTASPYHQFCGPCRLPAARDRQREYRARRARAQ